MLNIDHEGIVIDVNKNDGRLHLSLSKIAFFINDSLRMQTSTEIMS